MRGGERLVKKCSWMRGICSRLYHSTEKFKTFSCRCPSSVMVNNRFRSADYLPCQLFKFGMIATGNHNFERFAALCNTPGGSQVVQTFSLYALVGVDEYVDPAQAPRKGALCCGRILSAPTVWVGKLVPFAQPLCPVRFWADSIRPYGITGLYSRNPAIWGSGGCRKSAEAFPPPAACRLP